MVIRRAGKNRMFIASVLGMIIGWGGGIGLASASLITFNFQGNVTSVGGTDPSLNSHFSTADTLHGSFSFNSNTPNLVSGPQLGLYHVNQLSFTLGQNAYSAIVGSLSPRVEMNSHSSIDPNTSTPDTYVVTSLNTSGPSVGPLPPTQFLFEISGVHKFTDNSLPLTPPSIGNLLSSDKAFTMRFFNASTGGSLEVGGTLTSLTLAPVPLPGALLLFGSGLIGVAALGKIRRARHS